MDHPPRSVVALRRAPGAVSAEPAGSGPDPHCLPQAPACVEALLLQGVISSYLVFPEGAPARRVEVWRTPASKDAAALEAAGHYLDQIELAMEPAPRGRLLSRIIALLSHFRLDVHRPEVEEQLANDWAEDLGGFPAWAVDEAARRWRRTRKFKPQICEMVSLCEEICGPSMLQRDRLRMVMAACQPKGPVQQRTAEIVRTTLRQMSVRSHPR